MLVVVKYVVKEILPHFRGTFKSGDWGKLGRNGGVHNIWSSRTGLVFQLPNQARYQLRYTRIFNFCHDITAREKIKDFSVCGHLCGQSCFYAAFGNRGKSHKRRRYKAFLRFTLLCPGYSHGTPKAGALPAALHPDTKLLK